MKILSALVFAQLFLLIAGDVQQGESFKVGCYYSGLTSSRHGTVYPEDLDISLCSYLKYVEGLIDRETLEIEIRDTRPWMATRDLGLVRKLRKLKEANPDLKLLLFLQEINENLDTSGRKTVITNAMKWLNETGFDGLEIPFYMSIDNWIAMADFLCEMKTEFDKHGYIISTILSFSGEAPVSQEKDGVISKLGRCCDHVTLRNENYHRSKSTTRLTKPRSLFNSIVDWFIGEGLPAKKIMMAVHSIGLYLVLEDPNQTGMGARYSGPGLVDYTEFTGPETIRYKELLRIMNNSSLGWTVRRDNETDEPYAFSTTGLWASFEDTSSMSNKARYVMEKGLLGVDVSTIDLDDDEGVKGEGKFPLTRAVYNTFRRRN